MKNELKLCMCSSVNVQVSAHGFGQFSVICHNCGLRSGRYPGIEEAITAWNTRPTEDELQKENEKMRAGLFNIGIEYTLLHRKLEAAMADISRKCETCLNYLPKQEPYCKTGRCEKLFSGMPENWQWRGTQKEAQE